MPLEVAHYLLEFLSEGSILHRRGFASAEGNPDSLSEPSINSTEFDAFDRTVTAFFSEHRLPGTSEFLRRTVSPICLNSWDSLLSSTSPEVMTTDITLWS